MESTGSMRLQKAIAEAGICSRREAERLIREGHVQVNGTIVSQMGILVSPSRDHILVNQRPLSRQDQKRTLMLNKPRGLICSTNRSQGPTVFSILPSVPGQRLFTVGRLDKDSEGLLLLTNDGELANRLTHPRYEHAKTYEVTVTGNVSNQQLQQLNAPILIDGKATQAARVTISSSATTTTTLECILKEGRNRQIRKMCAAVGLNICQLRRTRIGHLSLGHLPIGKCRTLDSAEIAALLESPPPEG